jgi:flagellar basal body-associated protein FliL
MAETFQNVGDPVRGTAAEKPVAQAKPSAGKSSKKALMIVAVVAVQLVGAYFLVGFFLRQGGDQEPTPSSHQAVASKTAADPSFDHVYVVKDLIVNPAGTNGLRFLLTTIGLEVTSEETVKELEKRDVQIHDSIIGILTSRTLPELDDTSTRDSLKVSIKNQINKELVTGTVVNVYFSKFIIQ